MQYTLAVGEPCKSTGLGGGRTHINRTVQAEVKFEGESTKDKHIKQLEKQLVQQQILHNDQLAEKTAKIDELKSSILAVKEVGKLQYECKRLYVDGDEEVQQRISDISNRAAARRRMIQNNEW